MGSGTVQLREREVLPTFGFPVEKQELRDGGVSKSPALTARSNCICHFTNIVRKNANTAKAANGCSYKVIMAAEGKTTELLKTTKSFN